MLVFSRTKAALILGVCLLGFVLAIPSLLKPGTLPSWVPQPRVNLGLDLQGGSYLLLEVDMDALLKEKLANTRVQIIKTLSGAGIRGQQVNVQGKSIAMAFQSPEQLAQARDALKEILDQRSEPPSRSLIWTTTSEANRMTLTIGDGVVSELANTAATQSIPIVRRRMDETGVNEPVVARQGQGRILVELPGISDPDRIKRLLGSTAKMTFRLVAPQGSQAGPDSERLPYADGTHGDRSAVVLKHVEVDGANLTGASALLDKREGGWVVTFQLDYTGAKRFGDVTSKHVGEPFAIVLDGKVISAPVIRTPILGGQGQISGNFSAHEAHDLAVLLKAGALPAPLNVVEERSIGPSLGADAIKAGLYSIMAGFTLVVIMMVAMYGRFGIYAAVALIANLGLTITGLSFLGATLTLPGIAGILLALGMAVDANILVNERIREEVKSNKGVITSIEGGFRRAFTTIWDANATTLIKMLILFIAGAGAIRGFAITISLGILISMFTALILVRLLISFWVRRARPKTLTIGTRFRALPDATSIQFMKARYSGLIASAAISLISLLLLFHPGLKMGVDFAGGVVIEARATTPADYGALRQQVGSIGLGPVQVQQFGSPQDVLFRFDAPHGSNADQQAAIAKAREAIQQALPGGEIRRVEVVGPTVGQELLHGGLLALGFAAIAMFAYITFRFEWPFAVGAVVTMFLDLTKTLGFLALTGFEFNLASIAAILTIMGFSINDKVVVYDRVRENLRKYRQMPLKEVIDRSINETLSRTIGTSLALFLAIAPLALFGGPALAEFALTLMFGLVLATSSSIFIAAPILLNLGEHRLRKGKIVESATPALAA
ncbi:MULTISPECIES: protein translocase subunit SecD [Rhodomicrobium]|uniref:protein translocase subunit SecD n=1 Tax=Rhodomicrobium TaxID=1068 RepID=UPI000B4B87A9|nr:MULTISPECIES: protein translocase subunit SecD [Rhodomicrobium]